jgi:L-rhamnose mutarotase
MKEIAMTLNLKDDPQAMQAYRQHHAAVWPEVLEALQSVGVRNMRIWLWGRRLFMLVEAKSTFEPERDFARYLRLHPRCEEWEQLMGTFQEPLVGAMPGEKWLEMEQVFDLEAQAFESYSPRS